VRAREIIDEDAEPRAELSEDRAGLLREIWDRFVCAGRLDPDNSSLELIDPWLFPGSEEALHALLLNLLENACKAAPEGPVSLKADAEGFSLENAGESLPAEVAASLIAGQAPEAGEIHGHGLGEILRRAKQLNLKLSLDQSGGTRFEFRRIGGPRILVVEDDAGLRNMLAELIRREGFRVDEVCCFEELPARARPWHAVLADLGLPGESGEAGLRRIKREHPSTRTLLLTGEADRVGGGVEGVDRVLVKPGLGPLHEELHLLKEDS
jgi:CheY-like chemotaxis protein